MEDDADADWGTAIASLTDFFGSALRGEYIIRWLSPIMNVLISSESFSS